MCVSQIYKFKYSLIKNIINVTNLIGQERDKGECNFNTIIFKFTKYKSMCFMLKGCFTRGKIKKQSP